VDAFLDAYGVSKMTKKEMIEIRGGEIKTYYSNQGQIPQHHKIIMVTQQ